MKQTCQSAKMNHRPGMIDGGRQKKTSAGLDNSGCTGMGASGIKVASISPRTLPYSKAWEIQTFITIVEFVIADAHLQTVNTYIRDAY